MTVREKVDALVSELREQGELDTFGEALAALAQAMADQMDGPGEVTAAWAKELRLTLGALVPPAPDENDDDDWVDDPGTAVGAPAVRDPAEP